MNLMGFLIGRTLAANEGVDSNRANTLGLIGGLDSGGSLIPMIAVQQVARNEVQSATPAPPLSSAAAAPTALTAAPPTKVPSGDPVPKPGEKTELVPQMITDTEDDAKGKLGKAGFQNFLSNTQPKGGVAKGIVWDQNPRVGTRARLTDLVTLFVGGEPPVETIEEAKVSTVEQIVVPRVTCRQLGEAEKILWQEGFNTFRFLRKSGIPFDLVVEQSPLAEQKAAPDAIVTLTVGTDMPKDEGESASQVGYEKKMSAPENLKTD